MFEALLVGLCKYGIRPALVVQRKYIYIYIYIVCLFVCLVVVNILGIIKGHLSLRDLLFL